MHRIRNIWENHLIERWVIRYLLKTLNIHRYDNRFEDTTGNRFKQEYKPFDLRSAKILFIILIGGYSVALLILLCELGHLAYKLSQVKQTRKNYG